MFENVGRKIKKLIRNICKIGFVLDGIGGFVLIIFLCETMGFAGALLGLWITALAFLLTWISCFFAYGFGELVENSTVIAESMQEEETQEE